MGERRGCLAGLLQLFLLNQLFDWLQDNFGFGRGCSGGCCGVILLVIFLGLACSVITGTDWLRISF